MTVVTIPPRHTAGTHTHATPEAITTQATRARSTTLASRAAEIAVIQVGLTHLHDDPHRMAVVIDQAVDLRRALQSDHTASQSILSALRQITDHGTASLVRASRSHAAALASATNAAAYSLGPLSQCLVDELDVPTARTTVAIAERFIHTAVLASTQLDHGLAVALNQQR